MRLQKSASQNGNASHFLAGLGFGLAAGCAIGILYAPQSGRRTRRQIAAAAEDGVEYVASKAEDANRYIREGTARLRNEADELLERGKTVLEKGKAQVEAAIETGSKFYREATR